MPKKLLITMCLLAFSFAMFGQSKKQANGNIHKIVFQLTSDDTLVHKGLMRQLNNILNTSPD
ncbi:MAG: hypothetical protein ACXWB9_06310, partial [Flavisolibacter sp.]